MRAVVVIPARYGSVRFPGKPLADRTGKPLIQHVYERVQACQRVSRILVATDDQRIFDAVQGFGGRAVMTRANHPNGTSRIAEAIEAEADPASAEDSEARDVPEIIVNVQGDEPEIEPAVIDDLIAVLAADAGAPVATVATPFSAGEDPTNPHVVKVVVDQRGRALYFSRSPIPCHRDGSGSPSTPYLKHLGLYAYRREFLLRYVTLAPTPLEDAEKLEQLRILEHGHPITVLTSTIAAHSGIDTPEQYEAFVQRHGMGPASNR